MTGLISRLRALTPRRQRDLILIVLYACIGANLVTIATYLLTGRVSLWQLLVALATVAGIGPGSMAALS